MKIVTFLDRYFTEFGYADSIETLANKFGLSPRHLNRLIKLETGITASEYLRRHRLTQVSEYLKGARVTTLTEVAYKFDFYDQAHFIREFKRFTGKTPGEYRRAIGKPRYILNP